MHEPSESRKNDPWVWDRCESSPPVRLPSASQRRTTLPSGDQMGPLPNAIVVWSLPPESEAELIEAVRDADEAGKPLLILGAHYDSKAPSSRGAIDNVPPGTYHLSVLSQGYSTRRTEVTVSNAPVAMAELLIALED